jgi:hypothetical protein
LAKIFAKIKAPLSAMTEGQTIVEED